MSAWLGKPLDKIPWGSREWWANFIEFWLDMGFDCIPMEISLNCPLTDKEPTPGMASHGSESKVVIASREDFARYPWPDESRPLDFRHFEIVAEQLPEGVKIVGGVCGGPYEWVSMMMGTIGLSYALTDDPELVAMVFAKLGRLYVSANRTLAEMPFIGALRQGDDLGFKTATFLSPAQLRTLVFPIYQEMTRIAHARGKPFILHSCGNLAEVYEDLIGCGVDAKHSFEETIMPVENFKAQYGQRITPLGGLDVDLLCRGTPDQIRAYTRDKIERCFADGHWALGTGNSLTNYLPIENYRIVLEEGMRTR